MSAGAGVRGAGASAGAGAATETGAPGPREPGAGAVGAEVTGAGRTGACRARSAGRFRSAAAAVARRVRAFRLGARDAGMATAEYAIATLAAVGFAGLLVAILRSDEVRGLLLGIVRRALSS